MGLLRDCTTGCGTDGSFYGTTPNTALATVVKLSVENCYCSSFVNFNNAMGKDFELPHHRKECNFCI